MPYGVKPTKDGKWEIYRTDTKEHVAYSNDETKAKASARIRQQKHDEKEQRGKEKK